MLVITEAGLYRLIFRSDKSEAKRFQDWVFKEVLPSIRKTGSYDTVSWLRAAYDNAKTGKVQLALLSAMGIDPVEVRGGGSDMAQEIDVDAFWSDARQLVEGRAPLKEYFRVEVRRDGWLLKMNFAFIAFLKSSLPEKYTGYAPSDFKASLAMDSGWQPGTYKVRFGKDGSMAVGAAWLWLVKPESNTDQLALVKLVEEVSHAN